MKALVTSRSFGKFCPRAIRYLEENGIVLKFFQNGPGTPTAIAKRMRDVDILIVGNDPITKEVMDAGNRLKLIQMHGTGLDGIDLKYARTKGIQVANVVGINRNAVAEMIVALMLIAGRRIDKHIRSLKNGHWKRQAGYEVSGSCVGLIGLGNIGQRVVELLQGFSVDFIAYDIKPDWPRLESLPVRMADSPEKVYHSADYLILATPLTKDTEKMINKETLALMKENAILINASRGGLIEEDDLAEAICSGKIHCAALDAFCQEPLPEDSVLRDLDVVLTPHMAATSIEASSKVSMKAAKNIIEIMNTRIT